MKRTLLLISLLLLIPHSAYSHAYLIESYPDEAAELSESPQKVTLSFLGFLEHLFSKVEVYDNSGRKVSEKSRLTDGEDGTLMEAKLKGSLSKGVYTIKWMCISRDGHRQDGTYSFTIK